MAPEGRGKKFRVNPHPRHDIAPKGFSLRGDGARAGKLRQLFLETALKHLNCRESVLTLRSLRTK